ncbi:MAG: hypothetical protein L6Q97_10665 [Thermoanaerobaculia bacterium]|nr:hypothetical protein [Thermoanaerobaculia bacterium]
MSIYVEVILGSPLAQCAKFGVCQVEELSSHAWQHFQPKHIRHVKGILSLAGTSILRFEFPFDGMLPATQVRFFNHLNFRIEAPKLLSPSLIAAIGLPGKAILMPGLYLLRSSASGVIVEIAVLSSPLRTALESG